MTIDQIVSLSVVGLALNWLGSRVHQQQRKPQLTCERIGVASFIALFLIGLVGDGGGAFVVTRLIQSGLIALCLTGFLRVFLPFCTATLSIVTSIVTWPAKKLTRIANLQRIEDLAKERTKAARVQMEDRERSRPQREQLQRKRQLEAKANAALKKTEQQRRDDVRYNLRLLFQRHYAEIRESLSRTRFEYLVETEMGDQLPVDVVERKAEQMTEMILDFFEQVVPQNDHQTMDDLRDSYENRREEIQGSSYDAETKAAMLAQLKWEEDQASGRTKR